MPISSSGHLVIFKHLLNVKEQGISIEVYLHLGTLLAVIVYYIRDIIDILIHWKENLKYIGLIILGSIPTAIIGLIIYKIIDQYTFSVKIVGVFLLINAIFLFLVNRFQFITDGYSLKDANKISILDAIFIGLAQGMAVLPGISRSGFTIGTAIFRKIKSKEATKFSFLLSIPAVFGAFLLDFIHSNAKFETNFLLPILVVFIIGYLSIHILIKMVASKRLIIFSLYSFIVSLICLFII